MFTHDVQVYANLRIPTHDYFDLRILRNDYAMITQWLRTDNAMITHIVLSLAHCYALIRMLRNVTQSYAELRMCTHDTQAYAWLRNLKHVTQVTHDYSDLRMLSNTYAIITQ